jgi:hypothetical protein
MCGRYFYCAYITIFKWFPKEYWKIIHDKMDKKKTSILKLCVKLKSIIGTNFGFSLMGVITHGYKKGCFGHYCPLLVQMGS